MSPEEKSLLERTYKLAEENNAILKTLRRMHRFSFWFKVTYWTIIIGVSIGAFYFIQPYVEFITGLGNSDTEGGMNSSQQFIQKFQELIE